MTTGLEDRKEISPIKRPTGKRRKERQPPRKGNGNKALFEAKGAATGQTLDQARIGDKRGVPSEDTPIELATEEETF